jgi:hypothetical protein
MGIQEGMRVEAFKLWLEGITPGDFLALEAQWIEEEQWASERDSSQDGAVT